ncbi:MAG: hypothetical protein M1821_001193 [Bathelium mastoideum]|nr:MAG: hypothetical protein M1821_001193 [Bathelium mastoideum]
MSSPLSIPRELRDGIYNLLISQAVDPPSSPDFPYERRAFRSTEDVRNALEVFDGLIFLPTAAAHSVTPCTSLLRCNKQLRNEVLAALERHGKTCKTSYKLDIMITQSAICPTWLSFPWATEHIDMLEVNIRFFCGKRPTRFLPRSSITLDPYPHQIPIKGHLMADLQSMEEEGNNNWRHRFGHGEFSPLPLTLVTLLQRFLSDCTKQWGCSEDLEYATRTLKTLSINVEDDLDDQDLGWLWEWHPVNPTALQRLRVPRVDEEQNQSALNSFYNQIEGMKELLRNGNTTAFLSSAVQEVQVRFKGKEPIVIWRMTENGDSALTSTLK